MADAIIHADEPGQTLYVRIRTSSTASVAAALAEGTSNGVGYYAVTDAALVTAGLSTAGLYPFKVFVGSPSTSADHPQVGEGTLRWSGAAAVDADGATYAKLPTGIIADATDVISAQTQPRVNYAPGKAFTYQVSRRVDGTHKCTLPCRIQPGAVQNLAIGIDMTPLFGARLFVKDVGTPTIAGGVGVDLDATALGPRDTLAMFEIDGTATAGDEHTMTANVTMETDEVVQVTLTIKVFDE